MAWRRFSENIFFKVKNLLKCSIILKAILVLLYSFWTGSVRWNLYDIIVYKNQDLLSELIFSRISFKNGEWLAAHHHCRLPIRADSGTGRTTSCDAPDIRLAGQSGLLISGCRERKKMLQLLKKMNQVSGF